MSEHWKRPEGGPYQIAIPAKLYEQRTREVDDFFGRALSKLDHNVVFDRQSYIVFRFKVEKDAQVFSHAFQGEPFDPRAVIAENGKRIPQQMRWGLVPWRAKDIKVGFSSINARAETVDKTPAFRDAWKRGQRCLVVTDGFYEWKRPEKQPYAIGMADDDLMVMAGLWDEWKSPKGEHIKSCTIITCPPNKVAGALHDRMPVVLAPDTWPRWLGEEEGEPDELKALLVPCPDQALKIWPVDRAKIGSVRNKSRDIADPVSLSA